MMLASYPPPGYCRKCGMFLGGSPKVHEKVCFGSSDKLPTPYVIALEIVQRLR